MTQKLLYVSPVESFVDTSFFQELSRLKLDIHGLSTSQITIHSYLDLKNIPSVSSACHLFLDQQSFNSEDICASPERVRLEGKLYNCNSLEEFKSLDKQQYLAEQGQKIYTKALEDINSAIGFSIISFADLKKYVFYYWVCTPLFQHENQQISILDGPEDIDASFNDKAKVWFTNHYSNWVAIMLENGDINEYTKGLNTSSIRGLLIRDTSNKQDMPSAFLRNFITIFSLDYPETKELDVFLMRSSTIKSIKLRIRLSETEHTKLKFSGWERNSLSKLMPRAVDLSALIDPLKVAEQSVDLNLKLMKWRIAPELDLDCIRNNKVLILGSGTLGCYTARSLMAWGCRNITLVDNGRVSYSNPVRQPLFEFSDVGKEKAVAAAASLKRVFPLINAKGVQLDIPMIGHPVKDENNERKQFDALVDLIKSHDTMFLLLDSRETRWLPTLLGKFYDKIVMNAALGFDSYLIMKHGNIDDNFGCYFCNDVVVPTDSLTGRTLDQMCTVTRPGVAMLAASQAVELFVSNLQSRGQENVLGECPHQIRGFVNNFTTLKLQSPAYDNCSACSRHILNEYNKRGWDFVKQALNDNNYIEELSGLRRIKEEVENMELEGGEIKIIDSEDDGFEII